MIAFVFFSVFLSSINIILSLTMNYVSKKGREYKEQLRRYSSFEEELSLMTVVLQLYKERIKKTDCFQTKNQGKGIVPNYSK